MTSVPLSPSTFRSARTTVGGPPTTQPIELKEEWTSSVMSGVTPIATMSSRRLVSGLGCPPRFLVVMLILEFFV